MDIKSTIIRLKNQQLLYGNKHFFVKMLHIKGTKLQKKYLIGVYEQDIFFHCLGLFHKRKTAEDFRLKMDQIDYYLFQTYSKSAKKITLHLKNKAVMTFLFLAIQEQYRDNEGNAMAFLKTLKDAGVPQKNIIKPKK